MQKIILGKKGAGLLTYVIVALVLSLALIFIGTIFEFNIWNIILKSEDKEICKQSIQRNADLHMFGIDFAANVKCPTQDIEIKVEREAGNDLEVKRQLADLMSDCWDNYGEGKLELFNTDRASYKSFCSICHLIEFSRSGEQIEGFVEFLATEPRPYPNHNELYYEYLSSYKSDDRTKQGAAQIDSESDFVIDTSQTYSTIFVYAKQVGWWDKWTQAYAVAGATAATVGLVLWVIPPVGATITTVTVALAAGAFGFGLGLGTGGDLDVEWESSVLLLPYTPEVLNYLGCEIIPTQQFRGSMPNEDE